MDVCRRQSMGLLDLFGGRHLHGLETSNATLLMPGRYEPMRDIGIRPYQIQRRRGLANRHPWTGGWLNVFSLLSRCRVGPYMETHPTQQAADGIGGDVWTVSQMRLTAVTPCHIIACVRHLLPANVEGPRWKEEAPEWSEMAIPWL